MELTRHKPNPPPRNTVPIRPPQIPLHDQQAHPIEQPQHTPNHQLGVPEPHDRDNRLADPREEDRAEERPGHRAGEGEVVVGAGQAGADVRGGGAVDEDVVGGLQVEGFLDFGVGGDEKV